MGRSRNNWTAATITLLGTCGCDASYDASSSRKRCDELDPDGCAELAAAHRLGHHVEKSAERATQLEKKTLELRVALCAKGDQAQCEQLPPGFVPVRLDKPAPSGEVQTLVEVGLTANGDLSFGGESVTESELKTRAAAACKAGPVRLKIVADKNATHGRVILVLDSLKQANCSKIAFGTGQGERGG